MDRGAKGANAMLSSSAGRRSFSDNGAEAGPFVLSITSGKGGVGKTLTTINLAVGLSKLGLRVLVVDGDAGLANVDVLLGLHSEKNLSHVIEGTACFKEIILEGPSGIKIVPSGSGIRNMTRLSYLQKLSLAEHIDDLEEKFDVVIFDTGAGISDAVMKFCTPAHKCIVISTPEPHSMTDAYAIMKVMHEDHGRKDLDLLVNMAQSDSEALKIYERLADVARKFLGINVNSIGFVPMDPQVKRSVAMRRVAADTSLHTISGQAWLKLSRAIADSIPHSRYNRGVSETLKNLLWSSSGDSRPAVL